LDLELVVRETPEGELPGDATLDLIGQGCNVIVAVSWQDPDMLWGLARDHVDVRFIYFGHWYENALPNLIGFVYRMDQAGFLAGALAGMATETRRVAIVGGIPVPTVEHLVAGFERGVEHACPECGTVTRFTDSFADLVLGEEVGREVVELGADVLFNAAGASGSAAIRSAAQRGAWVIGVDWNEYLVTFRGGQVPNADRLLGSVVLRLDRQAYETIDRLAHGDFEPGSFALGVAEGGIEFLPSPESAHPRWTELEPHVQEIVEGLRSGEIEP
jgi:basic membrane lipoprotein Med (substrate-binding protein (PBP1-ABC) superfamily)